MKSEILEITEIIREAFGEDARLQIFPHEYGVELRLTVFAGEATVNTRTTLTADQINSANWPITVTEVGRMVEQLKQAKEGR